MDAIKVSRVSLLELLKANKAAHMVEFEEAMAGYRLAMVTELSKMLKKAKAGQDIAHHVNLVRPVSYEAEYSTVIEMLAWSLDETIELEHHEFKTYVQDDWGWKNGFKAATSMYNTVK